MRYACLVWLIAGCGFSSEPFPSGDPGGDPGGTGPGGGSGGSPTAPGTCDVNDAGLKLCLSFGANPMARDLINPARALVAGHDVLPILNTGGMAATFVGTSELLFGDADDINQVTELTFELWMAPTAAPVATMHSWLLDNDTAYFATYEPNGAVRCGIGSASVTSHAVVGVGHWHHVACSYTAADQTLRVHVDGNVSGCKQVGSGIPQTGSALAIGSQPVGSSLLNKYLGNLAHLHLYARALPPDDLCKRATGKTSCNTACPSSDGGGDPPGPR